MVIEISMREGRTPKQKAAVAKRVTDVLVEEVGAQRDRLVVVFREYPTTDYAQGGITLADEAKATA